MKVLDLAKPTVVARGLLGVAGSAIGLATTAARGTVGLALSTLQELGRTPHDRTESGGAVDLPGRRPAAPSDLGGDAARSPRGPDIVPSEPHAPEVPPVDVVGQALAAEAELGGRELPEGYGLAHEPRGSSRDEEHGGSPLRRAEADGITDEVAAALEGDVEPEEHLTEPLMSSADAKALAAEMRTMAKASDPHKG